ncbi:MAG: NADP-dependent oxidoreductase [Bacteroidales bacterium]|nr:NADP-dependent oxidoreductase [Bacteroidales bacterium]
MNDAINRQWLVGQVEDHGPGLSLTREHYVYHEASRPEIRQGEVLIRTVYLSPDPMNHAWAKGWSEKFPAIPAGSPLRGGIAGHVIASHHPDWSVGDAVTGFLDWADYSVSDGTDHLGVPIQKVPADVALASGLTALGMSGLCAYLGLSMVNPFPGETVLVSGASGAIGSLAGQIARLGGTRVIGIAGGTDKCALVRQLGFHDVLDYRQGQLTAQLAELCPEGVDVFFDNVGGDTLDAALANIAIGGRVMICGGLSHYGAESVGIHNHIQLAMRSVSMRGFYYFDHVDQWPKGRRQLARWLRTGQIVEALDIEDGFERVPEISLAQFSGGVKGRKLIRISDG